MVQYKVPTEVDDLRRLTRSIFLHYCPVKYICAPSTLRCNQQTTIYLKLRTSHLFD